MSQKKAKLMSQIINELNSSSVENPQTLSLIQQLIMKFYPEIDLTRDYDADIEKLAAAIYI
jgi:tRNA uridine 5-carbamoylmethylation protein Kti12